MYLTKKYIFIACAISQGVLYIGGNCTKFNVNSSATIEALLLVNVRNQTFLVA